MRPMAFDRGVLSLALVVVLALVFAGGCASSGLPASGVGTDSGPAPAAPLPDEELRGLVLLLNDRLVYEGLTVERALAAGPEARRELAAVLGRIGDPQGLFALRRLARDPSVEVRRAAVFSLGVLGSLSSESVLRLAAAEDDREVGRLAVAALARSGVSLPVVIESLTDLPAAEVEARLMPELLRFAGSHPFASEEIRAVALAGLGSESAALRRHAALALADDPRRRDVDLWRRLLGDADAGVRSLSAGAIARVGEAEDLDRLSTLLQDPDVEVVVAALDSAAELISRGVSAPPPAWRSELLERFSHPTLAVRAAALLASSEWLLDEELGRALMEIAEGSSVIERMAATSALAAGGDPRAPDAIAAAVLDDDRFVRTLAATATPGSMTRSLYSELQRDSFAGVRQAAFSAELDRSRAVEGVLSRVLADLDGGVRAAALQWLADHPMLRVELLVAAFAGTGREVTELALSGIDAVVARARAEPLERISSAAILEALGAADEYLIRRQAAVGLRRLGLPAPALGEVQGLRSTEVYEDILRRTRSPRRLEVTTDRGSFVVRLDCPAAPLTCLNFIQLGEQGFYDDLPFYRVEPGISVEGGDPRSDGWGGPGYHLRDEFHAGPLRRGSLVMKRSRPHTAGSIFRVLLKDAPREDPGLTSFGEVETGLDVVDAIQPGDRILGVVELPSTRR